MAVVVRIVGLASVVVVSCAGAASSASFRDPAGDAPGAPDVTDVSAAAADDGRLTFVVRTADAAAWDGAGMDVMVDADASYATGHNDGVDYLFTLRADRALDAGRWNGQEFAPYGSTATGALTGAAVTITVPLAELGNTKQLTFAVLTFRGAAGDEAPDGSFAPGTPPRWEFVPAIAPRVVALTATFTPARPVHGRRFAVKSVNGKLSTGGSRRLGGASCVGRLAGKRLAGGCGWRIPSDARGRRLLVILRAAGVSRTYGFVVR
jgi:hypothetical protein